MSQHEHHYIHRVGWLRAAVLGANDGLVSTASLIVGVAASGVSQSEILMAGTAGLVAGAMSMAAGEYVSVSSQADTERADLAKERAALKQAPEAELRELAEIYVARGVERATAMEVATQLTEHDALGAHARDELGIMDLTAARPLQAAITSAFTFAAGAIIPLVAAIVLAAEHIDYGVPAITLVGLAGLGGIGARLGGAKLSTGIARVMLWGAAAMGFTYIVGSLFGVALA
jgi:VIT1/CCC1 family predicted Fe2+/Mn2+ transporter